MRGCITAIVRVVLIVGAGFFMFRAGQSADASNAAATGFVFGSLLLFALYQKTFADAGWRKDPATDSQKSYATDLGIRFSEGISKGELSDLITAAKAKR